MSARDDIEQELRIRGLAELLRLRLTRTAAIPSPSAGADWSTTVPMGSIWELLAVRFKFVTSAVVANRFPTLVLQDNNAVELARFTSGAAVVASSTAAFAATSGLGEHITGGTTTMALPTPPHLLLGGYTIVTGTAGLDVGDQYSQVVLMIREWTAIGIIQQAEWVASHAR